MKLQHLFILCLVSLLTGESLAQVPQLMSYQAVIRDSNGDLVDDQEVSIRISILEESVFGASVYVETHRASTNENGLLSLQIGNGTVVLGQLANIAWQENSYFIKIETDPKGGTNYSIIGTQQLLAVPYAFHAQRAEEITGTINESDPVFQSSVASGITSQDTAFWNQGLTESDPTWEGMSNDTASISREGQVGLGITNPMAILHTSEDVLINNVTVGKGRGENQFNTVMGVDALSNNMDGLSNIAVGYKTMRKNTTGSGNTVLGTGSLQNNTTGDGNTVIGSGALITNKSGDENIAIGRQSMYLCDSPTSNIALGISTLFNSNGIGNIAIGKESLYNDRLGYNNVAIGSQALYTNQIGYKNTAIGYNSLYSNTEGAYNIAVGDRALKSNTEGSGNIGIGLEALEDNTIGAGNIGIGSASLESNTVGVNNIALGASALTYNRSGGRNIAIGSSSLKDNVRGDFNVAVGYEALQTNVDGNRNVAIGMNVLDNFETGKNNIGIGRAPLSQITSGNDNIALGNVAGNGGETSEESTFVGGYTFTNVDNTSNVTALGYNTLITANNQVRVGNSDVTSIGGHVDWSVLSDGRFKQSVRHNVKGLEFINQLEPVTYEFDEEQFHSWCHKAGFPTMEASISNTSGYERTRLSGFIAQEVEAAAKASNYAFSGIDRPKNENDYYSLRYASFTVPLVQAMQEVSAQMDAQQMKLQRQNESIQELTKKNEQLEEKLKILTRQFEQFVSQQKEATTP